MCKKAQDSVKLTHADALSRAASKGVQLVVLAEALLVLHALGAEPLGLELIGTLPVE